MLSGNRVPVLAVDFDDGTKKTMKSEDVAYKPIVRSFRGYAMHVTMGNSNLYWRETLPPSELTGPCNAIMLFRDIERLCQTIMNGDNRLEDYRSVLTLNIDLAPVARRPPYQLEAPTAYFTSTKTQEELLEPFRQKFREMPCVTISGTVDKSIMQSATKDFGRHKFEECNSLIDSWTAMKARGTEQFKLGNDACMGLWGQVKKDIAEAHKGPTWPRLVEQGGSSFVAKVAELYYTTNLNLVAMSLKWLEEGERFVLPGILDANAQMKDSTKEGYWGHAHSWKPSQAQKEKSAFRYAKFVRLWGEPNTLPLALATIEELARTHPNDAAILEEKRKIEAWKRSAGPIETAWRNVVNRQL
jgi:hypothetical protein